MSSKSRSPYRRYGKQPYSYQHPRCSHGHSHVQHQDGVRYLVCDVCNIVRDNALTAKLDGRRFRGDALEERKLAA